MSNTDNIQFNNLKIDYRQFSSAPFVIIRWEFITEWKVVYITENISQFGYSPEEILTGSIQYEHLVHTGDRSAFKTPAHQANVDSPCDYEQIYRIYIKNGEILWVYDYTAVIKDANNHLHGYQSFILDISRLTNLSTRFISAGDDINFKTEKEFQLTSKIFANVLEGIIITDPEGTILSVNPAFSDITGYTAPEVIGKNPRILKSQRHDAQFYTDLWKSLIEKGKWSGEIWNRRKNEETYPQWISISALKDDAGQTLNFVAVFTDITTIKIKEAEIEYHAFHDHLTGLPNRNLMDDRLEQAIAHAKRHNSKLALMF